MTSLRAAVVQAATEASPGEAAAWSPRRLPAVLRPALLLPLLVVGAIVASAIVPDAIAPFDPTDMADAILAPPGAAHLFGTDHFGRDVFSLVVHGARQSLLMGACAVLVGGLIGGLVGLLSGYVGGRIDQVLMRLIDIWMSVPDILLAIVLATALGPGLGNTIIAVGLVTVPRYARVMRAQVLAIRARPFMDASRAIGSPHWLILLGHVLPHTVSSMLVMATLGVGGSILLGASLSFIGLGVVDDRPDWGFLLSQGRSYLTMAWWFATFPGLAITALVVSVNMLGDALRNRLDPGLRIA